MALVIGIVGESGDGKTTSLIVGPDGSIPFDEDNNYVPEKYAGMDPKTTVVINADGKYLPFSIPGFEYGKNVFNTSDVPQIRAMLAKLNNVPSIKSVVIDTINAVMLDREMLEMRTPTYDRWKALAQDVYELIVECNISLRPNLVVYVLAHTALFTDVDGNDSKGILTSGKKLDKIRLESKMPIVLYTYVDKVINGDNKFYFETRKNRSTAKTPLGMFKSFRIPNSLRLVENAVRTYYKI